MDCRGELKLFGCAIPLYRERGGEKDIVAEEEEATMEGICIEEAAAAAIHTQDGSGGKMQKEGVSAGTQVQPSHLLVLLPQPEDDDDDGEEEEDEIPTTGGAAIISGNDDNNDNNNNNDDHNDNGSNSNSNKDNHKVMKPEKFLPCPRCKSLNTKFCYFNNGNANQPRHFCRGCQRYWTAGGALRNIPVGSGRRKSKLSSSGSSSSSTSHPPHHYPPCPFVNWTDGALVRSDMADSAQHLLPPQSAVLPTAAIGRRLQMGCSIQDSRKPSKSSSSNGLMATEDGIVMMMPLDEQSAADGGTTTTTTNVSNEWNGSSSGGVVGETYPPIDECVCSSSKQQPSTIVGGSGGGYMGNSPPFGFLVQPSPFGYGFFGFSPMLNLNQSSSSTPLAGWCAPPPSMGGGRGVFPWPLMPAFPPWLPWAITPPPIVGGGFTPPCSSSSLLALGKHPREGLSQHTVSGKDGCPLTLKTLRTREPQEAAQSTIWSSLGLDNNHSHNDNHKNNNSISAFGFLKGFLPKTKEKDGADETQEPHVNPAARTRSIGFHENI